MLKITRNAFIALALAASFSVHAERTEEQKGVPLELDTKDASLSKVVLIAGSVSNKAGQHEYFAGCAMMMNWLKQTPGVFPVMCAEGWPQNEAVLDGAKTIVIYMDGGPKLSFLESARWDKIKKLAAKGTGLVVLHQAVDIPEANAEEFKGWFGAVWQKDISCRGHWDMTFDAYPQHPITQGLKAFTAPHDGWLYNLHFAEKGVTPLVRGMVPDTSRSTADAKAHKDRAETVGWAFERADGGRSFGYTGCDLHKNWDVEAQRRLVVNGILWTAKLEVPKDGAKVEMKAEDITTNMDKKSAAPAKAAADK